MADAKSLTLKIGADTSDFIKELKKVDKAIEHTAKEAKFLEDGLKLDFDATRFVETQKKVQYALSETNEKAKAIRGQLKYLEDTGGIDTDGYRRLQAELAKSETKALKLEQQLKSLDDIKFKQLNAQLKSVGDSVDKAAQATRGLSIAAAAAAAALIKTGVDAGAAAGEIQDYADRLNISAESVQRWDYIAMQTGVEFEQLAKAMAKGRDAIGTAMAGGSSTARKALEDLVGDISKIPTDTQAGFNYILSALAQVDDSTLKAYYANEIFGERLATNLIPIINNSAERLSQLNAEFEAIGYLTNEETQRLADFDDRMNILKSKFEVVKLQIGEAIIPLMDTVSGIAQNVLIPAIKDIAEWFGNMSKSGQGTVLALLAIVAALSPMLTLMAKAIYVIPKLITLFKGIAAQGWKAAAGVGALAHSIQLAFDLIANWKNLSALEKILKSLAVAALVAAAAMTIFHASWSIGLAVGAITAGVVAGVAAIKAAGEEVGIDSTAIDQTTGTVTSGNYTMPTSSSSKGDTYNTDNSQYNISIDNNATGNLEYDAKALADEVIRQIVIKKQASGV